MPITSTLSFMVYTNSIIFFEFYTSANITYNITYFKTPFTVFTHIPNKINNILNKVKCIMPLNSGLEGFIL